MQEDKRSDSSLFITLTYDTKHVPITRNGFLQLSKRDVQLFFKRLRKAHGLAKGTNAGSIRYYCVGEYGGRTMRPHYHVIIFNAKLELIQPAWQLGSVHYGEVNGASVGYTLKYMTKAPKIPMHRNDDRQPEFSLMSKRLGDNYLTPKMIQWHKDSLNERVYLNLEDGKKIAMPRYYRNKIYTPAELSEAMGFIRGEMEKKSLEETQKISVNEKQWKKHLHNQREGVKASYKKMYKQAEAGRHKL